MPKISVIVPIYNANKYLKRCLESILNQTYTDFELLLIDDGSTDASGIICDEYVQKDSRISVFHKPNGGVSSARKMGLIHAKGQWINFVDADDYIEPDALETMIGFADSECDIVVFEHELEAVLTREEYAERLFEFSWWPIWGKLFRKGILDSDLIDIHSHFVVGEDFFINLKSLNRIKGKVVVKNIQKYHYNYNNDSGVSNSFQRSYDYELSMIKEAINIVHALPFYSTIENVYFKWLVMYLSGFMGLRYKIDYSESWIKELQDIGKRVNLTRFEKFTIKAINKPAYRLYFILDKQSKRLARKIIKLINS